ncbi:hypothetical protein [Clostridium thailandense]|uniref:hypothetical protein n=1 Tax=Clostridium thailandense TaxID=2794346 RepID=UPI003989AAFA
MHVKVNYPTDPEILDQLEERAAEAFARALINELPPKAIDELIERLEKELM